MSFHNYLQQLADLGNIASGDGGSKLECRHNTLVLLWLNLNLIWWRAVVVTQTTTNTERAWHKTLIKDLKKIFEFSFVDLYLTVLWISSSPLGSISNKFLRFCLYTPSMIVSNPKTADGAWWISSCRQCCLINWLENMSSILCQFVHITSYHIALHSLVFTQFFFHIVTGWRCCHHLTCVTHVAVHPRVNSSHHTISQVFKYNLFY